MDRTKRLIQIQKIIQSQKIGSQDELLGILNQEGFNFTQATLSRDLKYLKAGKMPDNEKGMIYVLPQSGSNTNTEAQKPAGVVSIEYTAHMAVVKTLPGFASGLAYRIDGMNAFEIIGTIAGDDTILVISREGVSRPQLVQCLRSVLS
jgi:transcriptional regulator of arginine metabolism